MLAAGVLVLVLVAWRRLRGPIWVGPALALAALVVLEVGLGVAHGADPPNFRISRAGLWSMQPGLVDQSMEDGSVVSTNKYGIREVEVPFERQAGVFRILCLGDSWTFGHGMTQDQTWPKLLQAHLRARHPGRRFEVVNAGQPGYSYFQGRLALPRLLDLYRPDLVIVGGFNPVANAEVIEFQREVSAPDGTPVQRAMLVLRGSRTYRLLRSAVMRAQPAPSDVPDLEQAHASCRLSLREMIRTCRERSLPILLFQHAWFGSPGKPKPPVGPTGALPQNNPPAPDSLLSGLPEGDGVVARMLDFGARPEPAEHFLLEKWVGGHPNAEGYDLIAREVAGLLETHGLLDEGGRPPGVSRP